MEKGRKKYNENEKKKIRKCGKREKKRGIRGELGEN